MHVSVDHHIDASDTDADGMHDWHYEYHIYRFSQGRKAYVARAYVDDPGKVAFLSCEVRLLGVRRFRFLTSADLETSLFAAAVNHLRNLGMTEFDWLTKAEGYVPIGAGGFLQRG